MSRASLSLIGNAAWSSKPGERAHDLGQLGAAGLPGGPGGPPRRRSSRPAPTRARPASPARRGEHERGAGGGTHDQQRSPRAATSRLHAAAARAGGRGGRHRRRRHRLEHGPAAAAARGRLAAGTGRRRPRRRRAWGRRERAARTAGSDPGRSSGYPHLAASEHAHRGPFPPGPESCFMSFCISPNCFTSRLTSGSDVPDPFAIRRRRDALRIPGSRRSRGVIERMIASIRLRSPRSTAAWASLAMPPMPGIIDMIWPIGPIFCIWRMEASMSSSVNGALADLLLELRRPASRRRPPGPARRG